VIELHKAGSATNSGLDFTDLKLVGGDGQTYDSEAEVYESNYGTVFTIYDLPQTALDGATLRLGGRTIALPGD
jgi:hypothetical protein